MAEKDLLYYNTDTQQYESPYAKGSEILQLAQTVSNLSQTTNQKIDEVTEHLAQEEEDLNSRGINVLRLGAKHEMDITAVVQQALNQYKHVVIPRGNFILGDIELGDNMFLDISPLANITLTGSIKNKTVEKKTYTKKISVDASAGSRELTLVDVDNVEVGDEIIIYNGGWVEESIWVQNATIENPERMRMQILTITKVDGNVITLSSGLDFVMSAQNPDVTVSYFNYTNNIRVSGGIFNANSEESVISFVKVKNAVIENVTVNTFTSKRPFFIEYMYHSVVKNNKVDTAHNTFLTISRHCDDVVIKDNLVNCKDKSSSDAAILVYDGCKNIIIEGNTLTMTKDNPNDKTELIGISIHTLTNNSRVRSNKIKGFFAGVSSHFGAKYNTIDSNQISHCVSGILVHSTSYLNISNNIIEFCGLIENEGWDSNKGAIVFSSGNPSYRISITGNQIRENYNGIQLNAILKDVRVLNNLFVDNRGPHITAYNQTENKNLNISNNSFRCNNNPVDAIHLFGTNKACIIRSNNFENVKVAILFQQDLIESLIDGNVVTDCESFLSIRFNARFNQIYNNNIENATSYAFAIEAAAFVNDYRDNKLINSPNRFNITDAQNASSDHLNSAPIGFKIHSFELSSDYIYYEKVRNDVTGIAGWQKVKKFLAE